MKRVGYWLSEKKSRRFDFDELTSYCRESNLDLIKIDLDQPLEDQGPFDVIFHKLTDVISSATQGDARSQAWISALKKYVQAHPEVRLLDPVENVRLLLDRHTQYKVIRKCSAIADEVHVFMPNFVEFTTNDVKTNKELLKKHNVAYPFLCKPAVANGSLSHQMSIIFSEEGLKDVNPPCVAHAFINHNALLHKVFIIGDQHFLVQRPSVKNLRPGDQDTIFFDSHHVSKPDSSSFLNELDEVDRLSPVIQPSPTELFQLAHSIQADLGLSLFGIDIIVENHTGRYALIDINAFPSYEGVAGFYRSLADLLAQAAWSPDWPPADASPQQPELLSLNGHLLTASQHSTTAPQHPAAFTPNKYTCKNKNSDENNGLLRIHPSSVSKDDSYQQNGFVQGHRSRQGIIQQHDQDAKSQSLYFPCGDLHVPR